MAEGGHQGYLCRYFLSGTCRDGDSCLFSHQLAAGVPDNVCRHYLKGTCAFGTRCRYDHVPIGRQHVNKRSTKDQDQHRTTGGSIGGIQFGPSTSSGRQDCTPGRQDREGLDAHPLSKTCVLPVGTSTGRQDSEGLGAHPLSKTRVLPVGTSTGRQDSEGLGAHSLSKTCVLPANWVEAPEFVPGVSKSTRSYEAALRPCDAWPSKLDFPERGAKKPLCPFRTTNEGCLLGDRCTYTHGELCDLCHRWCLHPEDRDQRKRHKQECVQRHEEDMELSFAVQRSADKTCGICMDTIVDKTPASERRFGILEKCCHVFCLSCIRTWRGTTEFDSKTVRSCPECRIQSDFVTPSSFWVDAGADKDKLISDYKRAMSVKPCRYFQEGRGQCPFGRACFYRHAYPDGREALLPPPRPRRRRSRTADFETLDAMYLWDFIDINDPHMFASFDDMFPIIPEDVEDIEWSTLLEQYGGGGGGGGSS